LLSRLANEIARHSLTGFEFAAGIPGTLGGAVTMNAGAYDGDMKQCLISTRVMDKEGNIREFTNEELQLGYRTSILQKKAYIVLEATLSFTTGEQDRIMNRIQELNALRREKQPLEKYSAGSTFKRPAGYFVGKLIHDAGLSGFRIGGAQVSEKHCGFLINAENATAKEFLELVNEVIRVVDEKYGVKLEPEIKYLGF
jgi:UDP-N-acetylmuramate dehydrogenase